MHAPQLHKSHGCNTVVTLLLRYCYNVVTLLLHCCYTVVTLLLFLPDLVLQKVHVPPPHKFPCPACVVKAMWRQCDNSPATLQTTVW
jgi:hypothetical protein